MCNCQNKCLEKRVTRLEKEMAALKNWFSWRPRELRDFDQGHCAAAWCGSSQQPKQVEKDEPGESPVHPNTSNDLVHLMAAEDAESAFSPNYPGWPPAEPPEHGWPRHGIGVPHKAVRDKESEC